MKENDIELGMEVVRRHELIHAVMNDNRSLEDHLVRVHFEINEKNPEALVGALLDFFIVSSGSEEGIALRKDILKDALELLDTDWLLLFYDYLEEIFSPSTVIPYNRWSFFTEDVQGTFSYVENPYPPVV